MSLAISLLKVSSGGEVLMLNSCSRCMDHSQKVALVPENCTKVSVSLQGVDGPSEILQWTFEGAAESLPDFEVHSEDVRCFLYRQGRAGVRTP